LDPSYAKENEELFVGFGGSFGNLPIMDCQCTRIISIIQPVLHICIHSSTINATRS